MTNQETNIGFDQLLKNEEFVKRFQNAENLEQVQEVCAEFGLQLTAEETQALTKAMYVVCAPEGELSEDEMEAVSGGSLLAILSVGGTVIRAVWKWAKECQDPNSATYKATQTIVDYWYNKGRKWGLWR